jgi:hypothetical protein
VKLLRDKNTQEMHSAHTDEALSAEPVYDEMGSCIATIAVPDNLEVVDIPDETVESLTEKMSHASEGKGVGRVMAHDRGKRPANPHASDEFEIEAGALVLRGKKVERKTP